MAPYHFFLLIFLITGMSTTTPRTTHEEMTPPSKPMLNRVLEDSVMISWRVQPNNGFPIQFFKVQYKEIGRDNSSWMTIDEDIPPYIYSYEVRDLILSNTYRFRIAAVYSNNDNQVGPKSEKFVLHIQEKGIQIRPKTSPTIVSAKHFNISTLILEWTNLKSASSDVNGYFIYYRESTSASEYFKVTVLSNSSFLYISNLKPGISYDIKMRSFNQAGASKFSQMISAKTIDQISTTEVPILKDDEDELEDYNVPVNDDDSWTFYLLFGFVVVLIIFCSSCAGCYKCKEKRGQTNAQCVFNMEVNRDLKVEEKDLGDGTNKNNVSYEEDLIIKSSKLQKNRKMETSTKSKNKTTSGVELNYNNTLFTHSEKEKVARTFPKERYKPKKKNLNLVLN